MTVAEIQAKLDTTNTLVYVIGGILIALAVLLVVVILSQSGKDKSLSGAIAGGSSDTYFGKSGGSSKEKMLTIITIVLAILFVGLAVTLRIMVDHQMDLTNDLKYVQRSIT